MEVIFLLWNRLLSSVLFLGAREIPIFSAVAQPHYFHTSDRFSMVSPCLSPAMRTMSRDLFLQFDGLEPVPGDMPTIQFD
jgi:hypothetical protein